MSDLTQQLCEQVREAGESGAVIKAQQLRDLRANRDALERRVW